MEGWSFISPLSSSPHMILSLVPVIKAESPRRQLLPLKQRLRVILAAYCRPRWCSMLFCCSLILLSFSNNSSSPCVPVCRLVHLSTNITLHSTSLNISLFLLWFVLPIWMVVGHILSFLFLCVCTVLVFCKLFQMLLQWNWGISNENKLHYFSLFKFYSSLKFLLLHPNKISLKFKWHSYIGMILTIRYYIMLRSNCKTPNC